MKRRRIKLLLGVAISGVVLVAVAVLCWPRPVVAFGFLEEHEPTEYRTKDSGDTLAYYRFQDDYSDVCAEAIEELLARGFREVPMTGMQGYRQIATHCQRARYFGRPGPSDTVWVFIGERDGAIIVSVEIMRHRPSITNFPRYILWRMRNR